MLFCFRLFPFRSSYKLYTTKAMAKIPLSEAEDNLVSLLNSFTTSLRSKKQEFSTLELRIAGGWVRDKLLGFPSDDIDIATSCLTGLEFATLLAENDSKNVYGLAKISANPEQSKHLETARARVGNFEIDFVQLRVEEYAENSRIPEVLFGTPLQDATRRDATINSLFYNIHSRMVEDQTGKGLEDLANGIIRTPIDPYKTFLDDPLRLLRCVRFAARFGFTLHPSIVETAAKKEIIKALSEKVSKERIGTELHKTFKGPNPLYALTLIKDLDIHRVVFRLPQDCKSPLPPNAASESLHIGMILSKLIHAPSSVTSKMSPSAPIVSKPAQFNLPAIPSHNITLHPALETNVSGNENVPLWRLWLAACLFPFRDIYTYQKKKQISVLQQLVTGAVKLSSADATFVSKLYFSAASIRHSLDERDVVELGLLLKNISTHGSPDWKTSFVWAIVLDLQDHIFDSQKSQEVADRYNHLVTRIYENNLHQTAFAKPILNGTDVMTALGIKGGKEVPLVLDRIFRLQLEYPDLSKDEAITWLKEAWSSSGNSIEQFAAKRKRED